VKVTAQAEIQKQVVPMDRCFCLFRPVDIRNRQKHLSIGTTCFWISAWAVTFTLPYLFQRDKAGLGPMIGFIYAFVGRDLQC
jgi:hypothetical protein